MKKQNSERSEIVPKVPQLVSSTGKPRMQDACHLTEQPLHSSNLHDDEL